jgi:ABC-type bacteriocin/lantibiotic exporter with double-glycine peptidase domain
VLWLALPVLVLQIIDRALPASRTDDLIALGGAVLAAFTLRILLDCAVAAALEARHHADQRNAAWVQISGFLLTGKGLSSVRDVQGSVAMSPSPVGLLVGLPVLAAALIYFAGMMAVPAVLVALFAGVTAYFSAGGEEPRVDPSAGIAEAILDSIWTLKAIGAENLALRRAERAALGEAAKARTHMRRMTAIDRRGVLFERLGLVVAVLTGTVLCLNGLITAGQLAAGTLIAGTLVQDAYRGAAGWARTKSRSGEGIEGRAAHGETFEPMPAITGNLMLNRVSFEEPADGLRAVARLLFDRTRLEIDAGETVLITGGDMHMQTAMLRLMAGLEHPQSGTVSVDGYDLAAYRPDSIRRRIAYVPPLGDVLPGTLMDNLTGFDPGRAADALGAARLTGLDVKAAGLTDGLDTELRAGAAGFPAGFRQHVAVTRALAFKPKVLLLDHATENLDSEHLRVFSEVLERLKGRVTIVFASSLTGMREMADREIDLDELRPAPEIGAAADEPEPDDVSPTDDASDQSPSEEG